LSSRRPKRVVEKPWLSRLRWLDRPAGLVQGLLGDEIVEGERRGPKDGARAAGERGSKLRLAFEPDRRPPAAVAMAAQQLQPGVIVVGEMSAPALPRREAGQTAAEQPFDARDLVRGAAPAQREPHPRQPVGERRPQPLRHEPGEQRQHRQQAEQPEIPAVDRQGGRATRFDGRRDGDAPA
jgi:hypothetical protein